MANMQRSGADDQTNAVIGPDWRAVRAGTQGRRALWRMPGSPGAM